MADRSFSVRLAAETAAYEQAMGRAEQATRRIGDAGEKSGSLVGRALSGGLQAVSKVTAAAAAGATILGAAVLKTGASYNTLEQQARAALTTILGSEEAANRMMDQVAEFAKTSPFPRQAFIQGTQQLLAFGMEAERIIPTLGAVQDAVAAAGGGAQEISEIVNVLAQVQSSGKFTAETLNQLGYRGVDAAKLMGDAFGLTAGEMRDAISEGTYDANTLLTTLTEQMAVTYGGAAENVKNTWIGATDRIRGAFRDISSIIVEPFISKGGGGVALDWANALADSMRGIEAQIGPLSEALVGRLGGSLDSVTSKLQGLRPAVDDFDLSVILDNLDELVKYTPLIAGVGTALTIMGANSIPILSSLGLAGINPVVAGLTALVALHPGLRGLLGDFLADLQPLLPALQDTALGLLDAGSAIIDALLPGIESILGVAGPAAVALGTTLGGSAVVLAQALVPVADAVSAVLGVLDYVPGSVTTAVLAFAAFRGVNMAGMLTPLRGVTEQIALQQTLARNAGVQVGFMGGAMATASVSAQRLGTSLKGIFLSNPIGLALAGITTAVGLWSSAQAKARQEIEDSSSRVDQLSDSLDENTGAYTENTRELVYNDLQRRGMIETAAELGISARTLVDAVLEEGDALREVTTAYDSAREAHRQDAVARGGATVETRGQLSALLDFAEGMGIVTEETRRSVDEMREREAAVAESTRTTEHLSVETRRLQGQADAYAASQEAANAAADNWIPRAERMAEAGEDAAKAYVDLIQETAAASQSFVDYSGAMTNVQDATKEWAERQAEAFNEAAEAHTEMVREQAQERVDAGEKTQEWADKQVESTETASKSWEDYYDGLSVSADDWLTEMEEMQQAQSDWEVNMLILSSRASTGVIQAFEDMGPQGAALLQDFLDGGVETLRRGESVLGDEGQRGAYAYAEGMADSDVLRAAAARWGDDIAEGLAAKLEAGETTVAQIVSDYDLAATIELLGDPAAWDETLNTSLRIGNDSYATADILGDSTEFGLELGSALGSADEADATSDIFGDSDPFMLALDLALALGDDETSTPDIDGNPTKFERVLNRWLGIADDETGTPDLDADDDPARGIFRRFLNAVNNAEPVIDVDADTKNADSAMRGFFTRHDGKTIKVGMTYGSADGGYADGGIADGGAHVSRQPMMGGPAYGRTNIRWGEPETGWEAYISGKPGMRRRNIGVLEEAARRLGMTVLDNLGTQQFANGGFSSAMDLTVDTRMDDTSKYSAALAKAAEGMGGRGGVHYPGPYGQHPTGMHFMQIWRMIKSVVPEAIMTSGQRGPGNTASGIPSLHGRGRAVDWVIPDMFNRMGEMVAAFNRVGSIMPWSQHFLTQAGPGSQHGFVDATIRRTHRDHAHTALEDGGIIEALTRAPKIADTGRLSLSPGWNPPTYNGLGRYEHMVDVAKFAPAPALAYAGKSPDVSGITTQVAELASAVASMPGRIEAVVEMDSRVVARGARSGADRLGARADWSSGPQLGRRS
ncbi:tape measure protein [Ornithinimicrobium sp. LYQ92]|uniref:tape measure protein n=1 Tax=Serinicoccus sp. LYQ92 TaxID=3378798 RepID=UPI0038550BC4